MSRKTPPRRARGNAWGRACDLCAGLAPDELPRPYGWGRVAEGDRERIVACEFAHGVAWLVCQDCWRRGGRWRARRLANLGGPGGAVQ